MGGVLKEIVRTVEAAVVLIPVRLAATSSLPVLLGHDVGSAGRVRVRVLEGALDDILDVFLFLRRGCGRGEGDEEGGDQSFGLHFGGVAEL